VKLLQSDATDAGKQFICRKLSIVGTDASVPVLAAMLPKKATSEIEPSDMARYALERISGAAAGNALRGALGKTSGKVKVGIINSLGERGEAESAAVLAVLINDSDAAIATAATAALGHIGGEQAASALSEAMGKTEGQLRLVVVDAYLGCADKLVAAGKKKAALAIYDKLYAASEPAQIRIAALKGRVAASVGRRGTGVILRAMEESDPSIRAAAIALTRGRRGRRVPKALVKHLGEAPASEKVQVLAALADRGDKEALAAVVAAGKSDDVDVRVAVFGALAVLGDASVVDMLAQAAATTEGAEQKAARGALYRVAGAQVDKTILACLDKADVPVKVELVKSIGERNINGGVTVLLGTASNKAVEVRIESLKVLRAVAGPENLRKLLGLLAGAKEDAERNEAENTVAAVARKISEGPGRTEAVVNVLGSGKGTSVRSSLLKTLGKIGDDSGLDALRKALGDSDSGVRGTAIRVLADWSNAKAVDDLLGAAKSSSDQADRAVALRGYIRLIGRADKRTAEQKVEMYKSAMTLASSADVKKTILSGLSNVRISSALSMAVGYLDDERRRTTLRRPRQPCRRLLASLRMSLLSIRQRN